MNEPWLPGSPDDLTNAVMALFKLVRNATDDDVRALLPGLDEEQLTAKLAELREYPEAFFASLPPEDRHELVELARENHMEFVSQ